MHQFHIYWLVGVMGIKSFFDAASAPLLLFWMFVDLNYPPIWIGLICSLYTLSHCIGSLLLGIWSDHYGRLDTLYFCLVMECIGCTLVTFASSNSYLLCCISRILGGLSGTAIPISFALLTDAIQSEDFQQKSHFCQPFSQNHNCQATLKIECNPAHHLTVKDTQMHIDSCSSSNLCEKSQICNFIHSTSASPQLHKTKFHSHESLRYQYLGTLGLSIGFGCVLGPLASWSFRNWFHLSRKSILQFFAFNQFILCILAWHTYPKQIEDPWSHHEMLKRWKRSKHKPTWNGVFSYKLCLLCIIRICLTLSTNPFRHIYFLYLYHYSPSDSFSDQQIALILFFTSICTLLYQGFLYKRLINKLGGFGTLYVGCIAQILAIFLIPLTQPAPLCVQIFIINVFYALSFSITEPCIFTLASMIGIDAPSKLGIIQSCIYTSRNIANIFGSTLNGVLYSTYPKSLLITSSSLVLLSLPLLKAIQIEFQNQNET